VLGSVTPDRSADIVAKANEGQSGNTIVCFEASIVHYAIEERGPSSYPLILCSRRESGWAMSLISTSMTADHNGPSQFRSTLWSQVIKAGDPTSEAGQAALEFLCQAYWQPLYWHLRRKGHTQQEAEDLTQSFFLHLLKRNGIAKASSKEGKFRSFLVASLDHFSVSDWRSRSAKRRGGAFHIIPMEGAEEQYQAQAADGLEREMTFDKRWALTVVDRVMKRLEREYAANDKSELFAELKPLLTDNKGGARAGIAKRHGITVDAVNLRIHRLRNRYGELLREEIADTVETREQVEDEIRYLIAIMGT